MKDPLLERSYELAAQPRTYTNVCAEAEFTARACGGRWLVCRTEDGRFTLVHHSSMRIIKGENLVPVKAYELCAGGFTTEQIEVVEEL